MKKLLLSFINQIIPVMIGVYLGFALNNFGENRKVLKQFGVFEEMLLTEIADNKRQIEAVRQYHIDIRKAVQEILASDNILETFHYFEENTFGGIRPALVSNSAYETGIQTGMIQEFNLETIQVINKTYTMQEIYSNFTQNMVHGISSRNLPRTEDEIRDFLQILQINFNDIQSIESLLHSYYETLNLRIE